MKHFTAIFDKQGQPTLEGRILYAHAIHLARVADLPPKLIDYVWEHDECRNQITDLFELLDEQTVKENPHPFFLTSIEKTEAVSIDWENLDEALEAILREALAEQASPNRVLERKMVMSFKAPPTLQVESPQKDAVCIDHIPFLFNQPTPQNCWLTLKNEKRQVITDLEIPEHSQNYHLSVNGFPSGLYYWTLLADGTPLTGRLYVCTIEDAKQFLGNR